MQRAYATMSNDVLQAVPLFMLMGYVMERAGIMDRMFHSYRLLFRTAARGHCPDHHGGRHGLWYCQWYCRGGCHHDGRPGPPPMLRAKYSVELAAGTITSTGTLGILIPPSVMLIVYAATAGVSIVKVYAGAFGPGFLMSALFLLYILVACLDQARAWTASAQGRTQCALEHDSLGSDGVLGADRHFNGGGVGDHHCRLDHGHRGGGAGGAHILYDRRRLRQAELADGHGIGAAHRPHHGHGVLAVRRRQPVCRRLCPPRGTGATRAVGVEPWPGEYGFLWLAMLIIFLLGWPLEWTEIIVIFIPIFLPLLKTFQIDPLIFGVMVAVNLQTSFLSPPVAMAAFYLKGIAPPHVTLNQIYRGMYPFLAIQLVTLLLTWFWPELTLWLPRYLYGE